MATQKISIITIMSLIAGILLINLTSALSISSVSMNPETIAPGESSSVILSIRNNGNNDLTDVSVGLDFANLPLAPYNSGSDYNTDELKEGKTKDARFEIIALNDAKSGIYKIPVKISYIEDNQLKTQSSMISIMINSKPVIETGIEDGLLLKGQKNKLSIKVINKGLADVKFLEVETRSSIYYTLLSQKNVYIGDVDSNDFQTAEFELMFSQNSPNIVNFPLTIKYKDISNKEYTKEYNLDLKVYSKEQAQKLGLVPKNNSIYYIIGIIIIIVIFLIYRARRKRKLAKEFN